MNISSVEYHSDLESIEIYTKIMEDFRVLVLSEIDCALLSGITPTFISSVEWQESRFKVEIV